MRTALCLPLSSLPPLLSGPFLPGSPAPLLHPCLNLLKRRCGLTVVVSHHAATVLCVTSAQYTSDRSVQGHYESQHLGGADEAPAIPGPANTVMFYTCPLGVHMHLSVHGGVHGVTATS